ncbi:uncharacterized protein LOC128876137 isoform X2 [Hylaeus volcanicus]|uniref:uncharacterized protein LOC128876137 isoform X2 n=1 Tax=Hylaeus volcanicus TaxID=313075 RepID=UPI0023B77F7F|nr:uncharacterized protein LOC128876137 isoform X2 [Hylaeus volcanicus]
MNTPTTRDLLRRPDGMRRRSARQALAVIPVNNSVPSPDAISTEVNAMDNFLNSRHGSDSWSPAPSPDELVIQKRGRRRRPIVWSPDLDTCKRNSLFSLSSRDRTPVKSPSKSTMVLRSTPRKRLALGDNNESQYTTPEKKKKSQSLLATSNSHFTGNLINGLRGLSHEQLVQMITDIVSMQEDGTLSEREKLRNVLLKKMPVADTQPLIDTLNNLVQNIYTSTVCCNLDDSANNCAYIHLDAYQKAIIDQGKRLVESQHWMSVMHYTYAAWNITKQLLKCKNKTLCNLACKCFKNLTHFCSQALKKGNFPTSILDMFADRLDAMVDDCEDIKICLQLINEVKNNEI